MRGIGRSESAADDLENLGVEVEIADVGEPEELEGLGRPDDHVFYLVGSISGHPDWTERVGLDGVVNAEAALADAGIASFVLVQTLAAYGRGSDETITEDTPTQTNSQLGRISLRAEQHLRDALGKRGFPARFVRAGTIYGPGRRTVEALRNKRLRMLGGGKQLSPAVSTWTTWRPFWWRSLSAGARARFTWPWTTIRSAWRSTLTTWPTGLTCRRRDRRRSGWRGP